MRAALGTILILVGVIAGGFAVSNLPPGVGIEFALGYCAPYGLIVVLGAGLLAWGRKAKKGSQ